VELPRAPLTAVIALGGNAILQHGQRGTIYEQFANVRGAMEPLVRILRYGHRVVLTHGNGPQVGALLLQNEAARKVVPPMPLGILVAQSEGMLGYTIQQSLTNALRRSRLPTKAVTVITQVTVDPEDPELKNPTKPVGPHFTDEQVGELRRTFERYGYKLREEPGKGWRIVVPSPDPKSVVEADAIAALLDLGFVVIASGGGGMPVVEREHWGLDGLEAVIDKDLASERLATQLRADVLLILTEERAAFLDFGKTTERALGKVGAAELHAYYDQDHFPAGSMGPKVLACLRFLEHGGQRAAIGALQNAWGVFTGESGTQVQP
jgi:carbamate kinase